MATEPALLGDEQQRIHGRMTMTVAFELPITETAINLLLESETDMVTAFQPLPMSAVEAPVAETIQEELGDTEYALYSASVGRGADGYGVALELANFIATYGGAISDTSVLRGSFPQRWTTVTVTSKYGHTRTLELGDSLMVMDMYGMPSHRRSSRLSRSWLRVPQPTES